jgi:hypothetical protein
MMRLLYIISVGILGNGLLQLEISAGSMRHTRIVTSGAWYLCQCEMNQIPIASPSSNTRPRFAM